jgi:hypothetical protein
MCHGILPMESPSQPRITIAIPSLFSPSSLLTWQSLNHEQSKIPSVLALFPLFNEFQLGNGFAWTTKTLVDREQHGLGYPVWVTVTGRDSPTHDLQKQSKNIIFGPELSEL